jgi:aminomethyltransferase
MDNENLKQTCLHDLHVALGAKMSPFAGYDMPIEYAAGIVGEHNAVRNHCGVFDVSHMGEINISGDDAEKFVNHVFTNDVTGAPNGQCFYGMLTRENGGVVDDLLVYKRGDNNFLFVVNASNIEKDEQWISSHTEGYNVCLDFLSEKTGELAVQGPEAESVMENVLQIPCKELGFYTFKEIDHNGDTLFVSRTGYTGEDGFEIYGPHAFIREVWQKLMDNGVTPCGLGCRDTLRFEVGLPLYGDELSDDITPLEAGLGMFVKLDKDNLIGVETLRRQKEEGPKRKVVGIEIHDRAIARHGCDVLSPEGEVIGQVTTGYRGISTERSICMALIDARYAKIGTDLQVQVRRKVFPATVCGKKFFKKSYKK